MKHCFINIKSKNVKIPNYFHYYLIGGKLYMGRHEQLERYVQRGGQHSCHDGPRERQRQHAVGSEERKEHVTHAVSQQPVAKSRGQDLRSHGRPRNNAAVLQVAVRGRVLAHHDERTNNHLDAGKEAKQCALYRVHRRGAESQVQHEQRQLGHHVQDVHHRHRFAPLTQEIALVQALEFARFERVTQSGEDHAPVRAAPAHEEVRVAGCAVELQETQVTARALREHFRAAVVVPLAHRRPPS